MGNRSIDKYFISAFQLRNEFGLQNSLQLYYKYINRSTNKFVRFFSRNLGLYCEKLVTM